MIDSPPEPPPSQEQIIEQRLVACGLNAGGFTVKYEDYLQGIEVVIDPNSGVSERDFNCIREAVGYEIVTFRDRAMQMAYADQSAELARPALLADARAGLEKRGLLDGFPERKDFPTDKLFAEAIERHCGADIGSFFVESEWGLIVRPMVDSLPLSDSEWNQTACLMNALMYVSAKNEGFKVALIGNEKVRGDAPD